MSRTILDGTSIYDCRVMQGFRYASASITLGATPYQMQPDPPVVLNANPGGATRTVILPSILNTPGIDGRVQIIQNTGTSGTVTVQSHADDGSKTVASVGPGASVQIIANLAADTWVNAGGAAASAPGAQTVTNSTAGATTAAAGDMTGASSCYLTLSAVGAANYTTRTAAQLFADMPGATTGLTWDITIRNTSAGTTTIVGGVGVTIVGTATLATLTGRIFSAVFTSPTAVTLTSFGATSGV